MAKIGENKLAKTHSVEIYFRICDDESGDYIQLGPDKDGLDMVEISSHVHVSLKEGVKETGHIVMPIEVANKLQQAIRDYIDRL